MDEHIARIIVGYLGSPYFALALRATCREWRALIPRPKRCSPNVLALRAARMGDLALCKLARSRGACNDADIASKAARIGHRAICELVLSPTSDDFFIIKNTVMRHAARGGHFDLCDYMKKQWNMRHSSFIMKDAARFGDMEMVLKTFGVLNSWNEVLNGAARGGHREICDVALVHVPIKSGFRDMLSESARGGHLELCVYARDLLMSREKQEPTSCDLEAMLRSAARGGHEDVCDLAIAWGARGYEMMMYEAASSGRCAICEFAHELLGGAKCDIAICNAALRYAATSGHEELCAHICEWGVNDLKSACEMARKYGYYELCLQLKSRMKN